MNTAAVDYSSLLSPQVLSSGARAVKSELGKNDFLQLLVAQLRFQDPLKPMGDTEFIAQLAQFSALEQMMNVGRSTSLTYGMSVLGKRVYAEDRNGVPVSGRAVSVRLAEGQPLVKVEMDSGATTEVELAKVSQVDTP